MTCDWGPCEARPVGVATPPPSMVRRRPLAVCVGHHFDAIAAGWGLRRFGSARQVWSLLCECDEPVRAHGSCVSCCCVVVTPELVAHLAARGFIHGARMAALVMAEQPQPVPTVEAVAA